MSIIYLSNLIKPWQLIGFPPFFCSQEDEQKEGAVGSNGYVWGTSIWVSISQWYWEISSKTILPNRLPLLFVEIALEEMTSDQYGSQWSWRRPLPGAGSGSKSCFQFYVISYLCSFKIHMSLKAALFHTYSNYDRRYYQLQYKIPFSLEEDLGDHPFGPEDPRALYTPPW